MGFISPGRVCIWPLLTMLSAGPNDITPSVAHCPLLVTKLIQFINSIHPSFPLFSKLSRVPTLKELFDELFLYIMARCCELPTRRDDGREYET